MVADLMSAGGIEVMTSLSRAASGQKSRGGVGREFSISYLYSGLLYSWISQMACI